MSSIRICHFLNLCALLIAVLTPSVGANELETARTQLSTEVDQRLATEKPIAFHLQIDATVRRKPIEVSLYHGTSGWLRAEVSAVPVKNLQATKVNPDGLVYDGNSLKGDLVIDWRYDIGNWHARRGAGLSHLFNPAAGIPKQWVSIKMIDEDEAGATLRVTYALEMTVEDIDPELLIELERGQGDRRLVYAYKQQGDQWIYDRAVSNIKDFKGMNFVPTPTPLAVGEDGWMHGKLPFRSPAKSLG